MNFQDFINQTKGKKIDVDGLYGGQCVDLFNYFNKLYNDGVYINCKPSGYARSLAENKNNNGILNYYQETAINNMITGTVVVYGKCSFAPDSHVCFFIKDNGDGTYQALQQNNKGRQYVTIDNNPYNGIIGAFIPKQLVKNNNANKPSAGSDQVLYKGWKVQFYGCQIEDIQTKGNVTTFYSSKYGTWLPITPFYRVDGNGNRYENQQSSKGNWLKSNAIFTVKSVSKNPDRAVISIDGKDYNVLSSGLYEVSNN